MNAVIQIITGTIGAMGFAILFNIRGRRLAAATIGGFLSWSLFLLLNYFIPSEPVCYFIVALLISLYSEIMARLLKSPTTTFIITSLVPLVPGGSLYYTMAFAFESDPTKFFERGMETLLLASALALGIIAATTITKILNKYHSKNKGA